MHQHLLQCTIAFSTVKFSASRTCSSLDGPYCNYLPQAPKLPSHLDALLDDTIPETKRKLLLKRLKKQELFSSFHEESDIVQHQLELKDNSLHDEEDFSILLAKTAKDLGNESSNIKMDGKQLKAFILNIFKQLIKAAEEFSTILNFIAFDDLQLLILDSTAKQKLQKRYKNNEGFVLQSVVSKLETISKPKARLRLFETIVFYLQLADEISTLSESK